jgi:hypothetical protein
VCCGAAGLTLHHSHKTWLIAGRAPEIAQARRLGHHLDNRVVETYSHVTPEVEARLLEDLERRWWAVTPPPPTPPMPAPGECLAVVPLFAGVGVGRQSGRGAARTPRRRRAEAGVVLQFCPTRGHRMSPQADQRRSSPQRRKPLQPVETTWSKGFVAMWS